MDVAEAFDLIAHAIDAGRAAHGYLVCGDLRGQCDVLASRILAKLFPDARAQVEAKSHPDVAYLEPEGKSRTIHVKSMRERIVEPMSTTAFSGGWKVGVVIGADRMEVEAANAFLKTLEEPTPQTLFLLLTDAPDAILPTIVSRSQRIDLPLSEGLLEGESYDSLAEIFNAPVKDGITEKARAGERLAEILGELKGDAEDADVALVRKAFFKTVMSFVRGWMTAALLPRYQAFRNIEAVEEAYRQCERSMNDEAVLSFLADRLVFPSR
jgi:DNA polymerase-3 subunit delta'